MEILEHNSKRRNQMNFNCQRDDLLHGVQTIGKAISNKNLMPILNGILLIAKDNVLTLRATDLDIAIQCTISVDVVNSGEVVIADGKSFIDIVRQLPDTTINIRLINDIDILINFGISSTNIGGF